MGRLYDQHILDMFEFGVHNYQGIEDFKSEDVSNQLKPILMFQGEQFEFSDKHMRLKNYLTGRYQKKISPINSFLIIFFFILPQISSRVKTILRPI